MAELRWGAVTDTGQVRPANEDNYLADEGVFVVADGMGGHQAGEVASAIAVERFREDLDVDSPSLDTVVAAVTAANRAIFDAALDNATQQGMGTTITALAVVTDAEGDEVLALANVGDSRTYLFRHERLRRVTVDHNYVQELVDTGHITAEEARHHPRRNIVTRALGVEQSVKVDAWTLPLVRGDRFLLCSDGLNDEVPDEDITHVLATHEEPQRAAERLVELANDSGGRDNISVIVVDVLAGDEPPLPDEELDIEPVWDLGPPTEEIPAIDDGGYVADEPPAGIEAPTDDDDSTAGTESSGPDDEPAGTPDAAAAIGAAAVDVEDADGSGTDAGGSTADSGTSDGAKAPTKTRKKRRGGRFIVAISVVAIVVIAFVIVAAWARRGYYVGFDNDDRVYIYQGRPGGVLWFDPTKDAPTSLSRDLLDGDSIDRVEGEPTFESRRSAENYVSEWLVTTTTTTSTTTTTTTAAPTTAAGTTPDTTGGGAGDGGGSQQNGLRTSNATPPPAEQ